MKRVEVEYEYGITVVGWTGFNAKKDVPETCICGHKYWQHFGKGINGGCKGCGHDKLNPRTFCHCFMPEGTDYDKRFAYAPIRNE